MHATLHEQPPALAGPSAVVAFDRVVRRAIAKSRMNAQPGFADVLRRAEQARERALDAFRETGGPALLGL